MTPASGGRFAFPALLAGAVGIAFAPILVRLSEVGPTATAFYRIAFALPVLWLWMRIERRHGPAARVAMSPWVRRALVAAGLLFAADLAVWHHAILFTSVANATLLANFSPIYVTLASWWFLDERFRPGFIIGMIMALSGAVVLMGASIGVSGWHLAGDLLALVTAGFYAGYLLTVSRLRTNLSAATIMTASGVVSAAALLVIAWIHGERFMPATAGGWAVLVALALVSHVGGQGMIAQALAHLPAAFTAVGLLLQPVTAAVLAWLILSEPLGVRQAVGAAIVLAGIVLARFATPERRAA